MPPRINRMAPKVLRPEQMTTYALDAPSHTHWRRASCAEVDCPNRKTGWRVKLQGLDEKMLAFIKSCGKRYHKLEIDATTTYLVFEPGQECFAGDAGKHQVPVGRPFLYLVKGGDWRGNPLNVPTRVHTSADSWVDDFSTHAETVLKRIDQG